MPFNSYDELITTIGEGWLGRDDLQAEIADWIWLAECRLQRELRLQPTGKETSGLSMTGAQNYIDLPSDFLDFRQLQIDVSPIRFTRPVSMDRIANLENNSEDTIPIGHCLHGTKIYLGPTPGGNWNYTLFYLGGIAHLTEDNTTNWLLLNAPDALMFGALMYAKAFKSAAEIGNFKVLFEDAAHSVRVQEWRARTGGQPLRQQADQVA